MHSNETPEFNTQTGPLNTVLCNMMNGNTLQICQQQRALFEQLQTMPDDTYKIMNRGGKQQFQSIDQLRDGLAVANFNHISKDTFYLSIFLKM